MPLAVPVQDSNNPEPLFPKPLVRDARSPYPATASGLKKSAVLVAVRGRKHAWEVLLTRRSVILADHRGQTAFPGGSAEAGDSSPLETALREAFEEVGIPPQDVRPLGSLDPVDTSSSFRIWPVVGILSGAADPRPASSEVADVFWIPLDWLAAEGRWEWRTVDSGKTPGDRKAVYFEPYQGHVIWGATAMILVNLLAARKKGGGE